MADNNHNQYYSNCWSAFKKGDEKKFEILHHAFFHPLYDYALHLLQDRDLAYDVIQELYIKLWAKRESLPEVVFVKAYLVRSLRSSILNKLRSLKLYELKISLRQEADIEFSPEDIIIKNEKDFSSANQLITVLNNLPARQREIIYLKFYEGLSNKEISEIMNIQYQSLVNIINRTLDSLKSILKNHPDLLLLFYALEYVYMQR